MAVGHQVTCPAECIEEGNPPPTYPPCITLPITVLEAATNGAYIILSVWYIIKWQSNDGYFTLFAQGWTNRDRRKYFSSPDQYLYNRFENTIMIVFRNETLSSRTLKESSLFAPFAAALLCYWRAIAGFRPSTFDDFLELYHTYM